MSGGSKKGFDQVKQILEAAAAKAVDAPCVAYLGKGTVGHYIKMVHNGIEYDILQLLAETYDFIHRGLGCNAGQLADIYDRWNQGELNSYYVEITADIFVKKDNDTGDLLVDGILDCADQKGTGMWMVGDALSPMPGESDCQPCDDGNRIIIWLPWLLGCAERLDASGNSKIKTKKVYLKGRG